MSYLLSGFRYAIVCSALACSALAQERTDDRKPPENAKPGSPADTRDTSIPDPNKLPEAAAPVDPRTYVIGAEDVVGISIWREPELSGFHGVRPDGKITLPMVGDITAAGLTPEKLKESLTTALSEYLKTPQVTISIRQVNSKKYYVTGEVNRTGAVALITPITVLEALSNAGGFREFANKKKIIIWRNGKTLEFNYKEVIQGKKLEQNILVEPGDHIIVQ